MVHERTLTGVPQAEAEKMVEDFMLYQSAQGDGGESELYRYEHEGREVLVALNFGEVVALTAEEDE